MLVNRNDGSSKAQRSIGTMVDGTLSIGTMVDRYNDTVQLRQNGAQPLCF